MIDEIRFYFAWRKLRKQLARANEERRKGMTNWKTTLFGALAAFVIAIKGMLDPAMQPIADSVAGLLTAIGLWFAKDHNK